MADNTVPTLETGFLGVTNPEARAKGMAMPIGDLSKHLADRCYELAEAHRHAGTLRAMALDKLPNDTDIDESHTLLVALKHPLKDLDDGLCDLAGYLEALLVRLSNGREVCHA